MELKISNLTDLISPSSFLTCPYCLNKYPELSLLPSKGHIDVQVKCQCLEQNKVVSLTQFIKDLSCSKVEVQDCIKHSRNGEGYCKECEIWLCDKCILTHISFYCDHLLCDTAKKIECSLHERIYSHYCKQCHVMCCSECKDNHKYHLLLKVCPIIYEEPETDLFEAVKTQNKRLTRILIERIEKRIIQIDQYNESLYDQEQIKALNQKKEDIQVACNSNESINEDLKSLFKKICSIAYPMIKNNRINNPLYATIITTEYIESTRRTIEEEYNKLFEHLQQNYVMKKIKPYKDITVIKGLQGLVTCLLQLKDGRLASGSQDSNIILWKTTTNNKQVATLEGHNQSVNSLIQLNDERLASCSGDCTVKLWNIDSYICIATLKGHLGSVECIVELRDGNLASSSEDLTIMIWNTSIYKSISTLKGHKSDIKSLVQLSDGRLASYSKERTIKLWNLSTYTCEEILNEEDSQKFLSIWNKSTKQCIGVLIGKSNCIDYLNQLFKEKSSVCNKKQDQTRVDVIMSSSSTKDSYSDKCFLQLNDGRIASGGLSNITFWDKLA